MIAVDTSIIVAVISAEPDALFLIEQLSNNDICLPVSVLVEAAILATNRGIRQDLDTFLESLSPLIIPLDETIARIAQDAHERYGKGRHKAALNFGDCLVYATAKHLSYLCFIKVMIFATQTAFPFSRNNKQQQQFPIRQGVKSDGKMAVRVVLWKSRAASAYSAPYTQQHQS